MNKQRLQIMLDIASNEKEIAKRKEHIAEMKEKLQEKIDNTTLGEKVGKLKDELKAAQEDLVMELKRKPEVNDLMEEIAAEKDIVKGLQMSLSDTLVAYFAETKERQVQIDEEGHAKDVIMSAKLGKDEHQYQTSIFNPEREEDAE